MKLKQTIVTITCGLILLCGITSNQTIHAQSRNSKITNRVTQFANTRKSEYYPQITNNTRDLGGYWNINHTAQVKRGMLYRSANLHNLSKQGASKIKKLHIKTDIDLRNQTGPNSSIASKPSPGELNTFRDHYKLHIKYINNPVETGQQEAYSWPYRKKYGEIYRFGYWYTTSPTARKAYHNSLYEMLQDTNNHKALLFNCNSGRDRTGVLSAITLTILGIPKNTIYNDFLLTNYYHYQNPYVNQNARLNRFYNTVKKQYGNMNNYLQKGLDLSPQFQSRFRKHFLKIMIKRHKVNQQSGKHTTLAHKNIIKKHHKSRRHPKTYKLYNINIPQNEMVKIVYTQL